MTFSLGCSCTLSFIWDCKLNEIYRYSIGHNRLLELSLDRTSLIVLFLKFDRVVFLRRLCGLALSLLVLFFTSGSYGEVTKEDSERIKCLHVGAAE